MAGGDVEKHHYNNIIINLLILKKYTPGSKDPRG